MSNLNRVLLIGNVTNDPESRALTNGHFTGFTVATNESWTDKSGQKQERTEWHNIESYGKLAEIAGKHVVKGMLVYVEGKLQTRNWDDNGQKKYKTVINVDEIKFLKWPNQERQNHDSSPSFDF